MRVVLDGRFHHFEADMVVKQRFIPFERILGSNHEPQFIDSAKFAQVVRQCQMTDVNRIERAPEYSRSYFTVFFHWRKLKICQTATSNMATAMMYSSL